jgi:hypothetical protein
LVLLLHDAHSQNSAADYKEVSLTTLAHPFVNPADAFTGLKRSEPGEP